MLTIVNGKERIEVDEISGEKLSAKLSSILSLIDEMQAVDTTGITPMAHPIHQNQPLREDNAILQNNKEAVQAIAPETESGHYLVPRVLE